MVVLSAPSRTILCSNPTHGSHRAGQWKQVAPCFSGSVWPLDCQHPPDSFVLSLLQCSPFLPATGHVQSDAQSLLMTALVTSLCLQLLGEAILLSITWYHETQYKTGPTTLSSFEVNNYAISPKHLQAPQLTVAVVGRLLVHSFICFAFLFLWTLLCQLLG